MFKSSCLIAGLASLAATVQGAQAQVAPQATTLPAGTYLPWMSKAVPAAWGRGFVGQGATIKVIDRFSGPPGSIADIGSHGQQVSSIAHSIAPGAKMTHVSFYDYFTRVSPDKGTLNIFNASFGITSTGLLPVFQSIVDAAGNGTAVVVAAAGNHGADMTEGGFFGPSLLQTSLIGKKSAIFVGALSRNGKPGSEAPLASYSNKAGSEKVAAQFVVVGVNEKKGIPLGGTSAAAPIVSGYAAIISSKFKTATPTQITNQILKTARTDTIRDYAPNIHGRGEASLSRALSPTSIK